MLSRQEAVASYLAGESARSVAKRTEVNPVTGRPFTASAVLRWVRDAGHQIRRSGPVPRVGDEVLLAALREEGATFASVGARFGLAAQTVHERYLRAARKQSSSGVVSCDNT